MDRYLCVEKKNLKKTKIMYLFFQSDFNVVVYHGSATSRELIRDYEFPFYTGQVLMISFEMILFFLFKKKLFLFL